MIYSQMSALLNFEIRNLLKDYLELHLPKLGDNWWQEHVINELSITQSRRVREMSIVSLSGLDLAALLRLLLKNLFDLSWKTEIAVSQLRALLRKVQEIRNRWAHPTEDSPDYYEVRKDIQALYDLAIALDASTSTLRSCLLYTSDAADE